MPKPGQVVTVAGNYKEYDPSLDIPQNGESSQEEIGEEGDAENSKGQEEGADSFARPERPTRPEHEAASDGREDLIHDSHGQRGCEDETLADQEKQEHASDPDKDEGSDSGKELPPDSDDESGDSVFSH